MSKLTIEELEKHLTYNSKTQSFKLKKYLFGLGIKKKMCECCKKQTWNNLPIPLELHHCDGEKTNNNIWNIQILCMNCHAQTHNFRGKNKFTVKIVRKVSEEKMIEAIKSSHTKREALIKCGLAAYGGSYVRINNVLLKHDVNFLTKEPAGKKIRIYKAEEKKEKKEEIPKNLYIPPTKIDWPNKESLEEMIKNNSVSSIARKLGVCDNAVRQRAKKYGINIKNISKWSHKHGDSKEHYQIRPILPSGFEPEQQT